ncbi:1-propanol dehydrogenase PduQ [uncultured Megasphaera sp.]|uniref:1-propanol dehydrogenase PduQ n=1 Tax=uncultured Megasphaera sp. TaxID=165188 RepID=UPI002659C4CB|nr:1-propanol dehydrogenase PduQ [uncultured Megasphaera sp.]
MDVCQILTKVISGENALSSLQEYQHERVMIICDTFLKETGTIDLVTRNLQDANTVLVYDDIKPDPSLEIIGAGVRAAVEFKPTVLVGFGGGAALDSAKGIVYFAVHGKALAQKPVFIAIPTTSGTGSEMTAFTVLTDTEAQKKIALIDDIMYANVAILDPALTATVPPSITANTGFDVITHAVEAFVAKSATDFTDAIAVKALQLSFQSLPKCYHYGANMKARSDMSSASNMAGIAFNLGGLGMVHSMAHQLGGMFHIPHGLACALCLNAGIAYNSQNLEVAAKYAEISYQIGFAPRSASVQDAITALRAVLRALMSDMGMPSRVGELKQPVSREDYEAAVHTMAVNAMADGCLPQNPRETSVAVFETLFRSIY